MKWLALAVFAGASAAVAAPPEQSLRPELREDVQQEVPRDRTSPPVADGLVSSLRPEQRPRRVTRQFERRAREQRRLAERGAICGDLEIQGELVGRVPGRLAGCGVDKAVRVRNVAGVAPSQSAVMECSTAAALKKWVKETARPTLSGIGGGLSELRVAAHYVCRTRNHQPGAPISEHGRGRAIDISAFELDNGQSLTVREGWQDRRVGQLMRRMHEGACGPFKTVLGPDADRFHLDHFHFDTAQRRGGRFCR